MVEKTNIETILSSLDRIKRAEAPPFLYTNIQARLNSPRREFFENLTTTLSKPIIAISFLFLVLFIDVAVYRSTLGTIKEHSKANPSDFIETAELEEMLFYPMSENDFAYSY